MIARMLVTLLAFLSVQLSLEAGIIDTITNIFTKEPLPQPPSIKALLTHDQDGVILEVKGKYKIYDPRNGELISTRFVGKRRFIQAVREGLKWGEEFPGIYQIVIVPDSPQTTTIVDGIEYRGSIYIYDIGGSISVVNQLDIEDYLSSIMTPKFRDPQQLEFKEPLPYEMLAVFAITARTNAYWQSQNSKTPYWDVDAKEVGYKGYAVVNPTSQM